MRVASRSMISRGRALAGLIAAAVEAEVEEYVSSFTDEVDEDGKRLVVRSGRARERRLTVGSGTVPIRAPIESSFATVKLRTKVTKGAGSKKAALATAYKLLDAAQERWRRVNGHELVSEVLAGVKFKGGIKVTDDDTTTTDESPPDASPSHHRGRDRPSLSCGLAPPQIPAGALSSTRRC